MKKVAPDAGAPESRYAALDLGSNSFHMVVARLRDGQPQVLDRLREPVRLAAGLRPDGSLTAGAQRRALAAIERLAERVRHLPQENVRVVGTNALRHASRGDAFLAEAERLLGRPIEIISGQEEARLIHLGVMRSAHPPGERCLVLDIGGGSTEAILGTPTVVESAHSLDMGCVGYTKRFFPDGRLPERAYRRAVKAARHVLEPYEGRYRDGWEHALGSSGTFRAVARLADKHQWTDRTALTPEAVQRVVRLALDARTPEGLVAAGVGGSRSGVFAAGLAIVDALFAAFELDRVTPVEGALREGVLYDLLGRHQHEDVREETIALLQERHHVDRAQAARVEATALRLLEQTFASWSLGGTSSRRILSWAARVHEIGLSISHESLQDHSAYLLQHSHLPGFSREEQTILAAVAGAHRGSIDAHMLDNVPSAMRELVAKFVVLLRLAAGLHRNRSPQPIPRLEVAAEARNLSLAMPKEWLADHPLTRHHLRQEEARLSAIGIHFQLR